MLQLTDMKSFWNDLPQPFFILAPMEAVTDVVFRRVVARAGRPDIFFTEFANATGWVHAGDKAIAGRLIKEPFESPIVAQIWGGEPGDMEQFARHCAELGFDGIDINMGCPAKSAIKSGGAALIRRPDIAVASIAAAKTAGLPVSVKTRLGYTYVDEWRDWLRTILEQEVVNLTIHLRTKKEMSKVPAHFELIDEIVALRDEVAPQTLLTINGDICNRAHGLELAAKHPGVNGIMIGRGVFADPFCFVDTSNSPFASSPTEISRTASRRASEDARAAECSGNLLASGSTTKVALATGGARRGSTPTEASASERRRGADRATGPVDSDLRENSMGIFDDGSGINESSYRSAEAAKEGVGKVSVDEEANEKEQLFDLLRYHLDLFDHYQPQTGRPFETLKRFFKIYIKGFDGVKELRDQLMHAKSTDEVRAIITNFLRKNSS